MRRRGGTLAGPLGFSEAKEYELAIAAGELAQNLVHHTTDEGTITWCLITGAGH